MRAIGISRVITTEPSGALRRTSPRDEVVCERTGCASRGRILIDADAGKKAPCVGNRLRFLRLEAEDVAPFTAHSLGQRGEMPGIDPNPREIGETARRDEQMACAC